MSRDELIDGYRELHRRLLADAAIARRIRSKCRSLGRPAGGMEYPAATGLAIVARLLWRGILPGGAARYWHFLRTIPWRKPWQFPFVIGDWIVGLSMQDYVRRHFGAAARTDTQAGGVRLARLARTLRRLRAGQVSVSPDAPQQSALVLDLRLHAMPGRALRRIGADLGALLRETPARLTLNIDQVSGADLPRMRRLLRRLRRFADRISIETGSLHAPMLSNAWPFQLRLRASAPGA